MTTEKATEKTTTEKSHRGQAADIEKAELEEGAQFREELAREAQYREAEKLEKENEALRKAVEGRKGESLAAERLQAAKDAVLDAQAAEVAAAHDKEVEARDKARKG